MNSYFLNINKMILFFLFILYRYKNIVNTDINSYHQTMLTNTCNSLEDSKIQELSSEIQSVPLEKYIK